METAPASRSKRPCPVCHRRVPRPCLKKKDLVLVQCDECGTIYADDVASEFAGTFYNDIAESLYLSEEKLKSDYASVRFERELRLLRRHLPAGRVLDVGCSTGAFLYQLKQRWAASYEILGTDICQPALNYARQQQVPVIDESFMEHDFGDQRFDGITFWAVLEHLLKPRRFVAKAADLLKPGGFCFILVPNFDSLATRILREKYRYIFPQHVNYFTRATLRKLVALPHWETVEEGSCHFNPIVIWQDKNNKTADFISDQDRVALLRATTSYKQNPILKPVKWAYQFTEKCLGTVNLADNIYIVLKKPNHEEI